MWYGNDLPLSSFPAPRNKNPSNISVVFHRGKDLIGIQVKTDVEGLLVEELRVEGLLVEVEWVVVLRESEVEEEEECLDLLGGGGWFDVRDDDEEE